MSKGKAEDFLEYLLEEGELVPCDETLETFQGLELPPYYDEALFKRGQRFFHNNLFGMMLNKFLGLITVLSLQDGLGVLMLTGMSNSDLTAFRRYLATIKHVFVWYDNDLTPGSKLYESLRDVKRQHNSASKKSMKVLKYRIKQKDMVLTQFGFFGYALVRPKMFGIHDPNEQDLKGLIHVWRVLGYILGIEDRFNMCKESIEETKDICNLMINKIFKSTLKNANEDVITMIKYLVNGMQVYESSLSYNFVMTYLQMVIEDTTDYKELEEEKYQKISGPLKIKLYVSSFLFSMFKFGWIKYFINSTYRLKLWLFEKFPLSAILKYGYRNSFVDIFKRSSSSVVVNSATNVAQNSTKQVATKKEK